MSLKDRLNSAQIQAQSPKVQEIKETVAQPKYYETNDESLNVNSLGIIDTLLADDEINSIFVNGAKNIYIEKKGKSQKTNSTFRDDVQLENIIKKYLAQNAIEYKNQNFFNINHEKGVNVSITLPPLSQKITMSIKNYNDKFASLKTLEEAQAISKEIALFLETLSVIDVNVLILGAKKSLKTTLLSALIKTLQNNHRCCVFDFLNEIKTNRGNCAYFDFSSLDKTIDEKSVFESLIYSNPDKIFINDSNEEITKEILELNKKRKGIFSVLDIDNLENAYDKFTKENFLKSFDIIITTKKISSSVGKISNIAQVIKTDSNFELQNIFSLNNFNEHISLGVIPKIYDEIKLNSLPLNQNIFFENCKHTYHKDLSASLNSPSKKNINIDILKKFKKDLAIAQNEALEENQEISQENKEETQEQNEIKEETSTTPLDLLNQAINEEILLDNNDNNENL